MKPAVTPKEEIGLAISYMQRIIRHHEKILAILLTDPYASPVAVAQHDQIIYESMMNVKYFESLPASAPAFI